MDKKSANTEITENCTERCEELVSTLVAIAYDPATYYHPIAVKAREAVERVG